MTVKSIRVHEADFDGAKLYCYGDGEFKINSTNGMFQSASHLNSAGHGWNTSGTDIQSNGWSAQPPALFEGDNAEIVNNGVFECEWTGTGTSEQANSPISFAIIQNDSVDAGLWVYVTGSTPTLTISIQSYTSGDVFIQNEGSSQLAVTANEWNYLTTSTTVSAATAAKGRIIVDASGAQSIGDKMYLGMAHANVNDADGDPRPSTLMDKQFKLRTRLQQVGGTSNAGTVAQSLSGDWQINATYSAGYARLTYVNDVGGTAFSQAIPVDLDVEREYDIEISHVYSSGSFEMAFWEDATRRVAYSTTLTTTTGDPNLASYGLDIMPDNWGIVSEMILYDDQDTEVSVAPIASGTAIEDGVNDLGETLSVAQGIGEKNQLLLSDDAFEISRNFTGSVGFSVLKSDRDELDFSGDFFVACAVQTRNDAALDIVSSHSGTDGWRISSVGGTAPAQQWEAVFTEGSTDISQTVATTINDGAYHYMGFQREAGVEYNIYSDDFDTAAHTVADTHTSLDGATSLDFLTEWQGAAGALIIIPRLLTDEERGDLGDWLEFNAGYDAPPYFIDEAIVYVNPASPIQREAIRDRRMVNLAHRPHDTLYVRYALTSTDGVANPSLDSMHLEIPELGQELGDAFVQGIVTEASVGPLEWQKGWLMEKGGTNNLKTLISPSEEELDNRTLTLITAFTKTTNNVTGVDDDENIFEDAGWRLYYADGTSSIIFEQDGVTQSTTVNALTVGETYLITLEIDAGNVDIRVDGTSIDSFAHNFANITPSGIEFGGSGDKRLHAVLHFAAGFGRNLLPEEENEILSVMESAVDFSETITLTESFDYAELNWG